MNALVLALNMRPPPPVANSVAFACSDHDFAGFHVQRRHAEHIAFLITNQIQPHPFDKKLGVGPHIALI